MSNKLPPLELTEIEILHCIVCEKIPQGEQNIKTQLRLHNGDVPIGQTLDKLISKVYIIYTDHEGNADEDGEFYVMSQSGKEWARDTLIHPW